ncbi:Thiosulfate reductase electron transport protein phsB [hydrothermal vent metagenome]|uniref:Thiosulfate reductase electron transport protein phsB n=1 Tax=hydrothermal vent metagenome TaxID=652676 RepID=A0A1W1CMM8_9ZZZZ|nr:4Fe-4S dicluster domain-containing protein [Sulfurovum sp.]
MARYGMALDYKNCINCRACEVACKEENGVELGAEKHRIWVGSNNPDGEWPNLSLSSAVFLPSQCQHCEEAPCQEVCPTNATYYNDDGIVLVDSDKCILCTYCMNACPYDARYVDERTMTVDKCTFCSDTRLARGETTTACQATCPTKVRTFGDLDDPNSEISQLLENREHFSLKAHLGTKPKLFYLR